MGILGIHFNWSPFASPNDITRSIERVRRLPLTINPYCVISSIPFSAGDLEAQIRKEKDKNASLFEECERLKKNIEKLKENMSEVEV